MTIGFALCGSFCTFAQVFPAMEALAKEHRVIPIFSEHVQNTDTRFGNAADFYQKAFAITGTEPVCSIPEAEPIGPKKLLDALVIAPCTGNTLGKLSCGITDTTVTMAAKAHLRNGRPLILAVSTNDGLSGSAENLGRMLNRKNIYFVPFGQDDPRKKPTSLVADFARIPETVQEALMGRQLQPVLL